MTDEVPSLAIVGIVLQSNEKLIVGVPMDELQADAENFTGAYTIYNPVQYNVDVEYDQDGTPMFDTVFSPWILNYSMCSMPLRNSDIKTFYPVDEEVAQIYENAIKGIYGVELYGNFEEDGPQEEKSDEKVKTKDNIVSIH